MGPTRPAPFFRPAAIASAETAPPNAVTPAATDTTKKTEQHP
jgi:hypothetical protein